MSQESDAAIFSRQGDVAVSAPINHPAMCRFVTSFLLATAAVSPVVVSALPATPSPFAQSPRARDTLKVHAPFSNPTTACTLFDSYASWAVSPLAKPADMRSTCASEAAAGNVDAGAIYGQMQFVGYGAAPDTPKGITTLERAALDGSRLAQRVLRSTARAIACRRITRRRVAGSGRLRMAETALPPIPSA
jgi:hypothetical protein